MGKQGKKSKSKRVSLKQKHKVLKKVKLHHKKKAKEAKNLGLNKKKTKVEKDPGIPNDWPLKEEELKALEARRARKIEELELKKAASKERGQKRKLGMLDDDDDDTSNPADKEQAFGMGGKDSTRSTNYRDNSDRVFYKELAKVIEASDVILEVLDARDPLGTRCVDMEKMVIKAGHEKHLVLLLNKIDLVPREAVEKWLKYLREELPAVAFKCSTQEQRSNLGWKSGSKGPKGSKAAKPSTILQTSDCLGAETLIKLLKNYSRSHEIKRSITVGVVGLPNVGKSSLINSLKRSHVANVGATPGLTRSMQEVQLDKNVKLLDCPGVVMLKSGESDASIALRNCKRIEKLDDPVAPVKEILKLCPGEMLVSLYKMPTFDSVDDFLQKVAIVRGKLKKGGVVDVDSAARIVLHDWNEGKIPYYTMPPNRNTDVPSEAKIVTEFGKEFNADEVYGTESSFIGSLKSVDDFQPVEVPPKAPISFDQAMLENDVQPEPSTRSEEPMESLNGNEDQTMVEEADEADKKMAKSANSRQNEKLYAMEGVLNPKARKAEKKRRKKANKNTAAAEMEDDKMDGDYDFKADYVKEGSDMEAADEDDSTTNEVSKNRFELPAASEGDVV